MPNVLLITSDQHNPFFCGYAGDSLVHTPNLDALAEAGTVFETAYTNSPICMPARASLATGRYGSIIGAYDNGSPYEQRHADSFGHRARAAGLPAVTFGKLHFDPDSDSGFDMRLPLQATKGYIGARMGWMRGDAPPTGVMVQHALDAAPGPSEYELYDRHTTTSASRWLHAEAPHDQPWLAHVSYAHPHYPFRAPADLLPADDVDVPLPPAWQSADWPGGPELDAHRRLMRYDERPLNEGELRHLRWVYAGMVNFVDEQVGLVLDALNDAGFADDTVVIYTSDHGDMLGSHGFVMKSVMYDGAARVPLIVRGPGIDPGQRSSTAASLVDVFPTVLDALRIVPNPRDHDLPGDSLLEVAGGADDPSRIAFSEYHGPSSTAASYMVRQGRWKYVRHMYGDQTQLFDIVADPDELDDRAADPEFEATMGELDAALRDVVDPEETDERIRSAQTAQLAGVDQPPARSGSSELPRTPMGTIARGWTIPSPEMMTEIAD